MSFGVIAVQNGRQIPKKNRTFGISIFKEIMASIKFEFK